MKPDLEAVSGGIQEGLEASAAPPRSPPVDTMGEVYLLRYWLLRAYKARQREGWEEGPTEAETFDRVLDVLCNIGLDPTKLHGAADAVLAGPEWYAPDTASNEPAPQAPPKDSPSQGERKQQLLDQDRAATPQSPTEPRSFVAGQECDECEKKIAMACLPCDFGGCEEHAAEHNKRCPEEPHHHGSSPWSAECVECERMTSRFNRDVAEERERKLKQEIGRLQDAWFCDETIAPDGNLRALVSRTVARAAEAEALLSRIHKISDPNRRASDKPAAGPSSSSSASLESGGGTLDTINAEGGASPAPQSERE